MRLLETRLVRAVLWPQHKLKQLAEAVLLGQSEAEVVFCNFSLLKKVCSE